MVDVKKLLEAIFNEETENESMGGYVSFEKEDICIDGWFDYSKMQKKLDKFLESDKNGL